MSDFGQAVRQLRERLNLTQVQFARQLAVSRLTVVHWESGRKQPRARMLGRLGRLAGMNGVEWGTNGR